MTETARTRAARTAPLIAAALGVAALAFRLWSVAALSGAIEIRQPILDGRYYLELATRLSRGSGWGDQPIFMSPLYPWLLSLLFRIAPPTVLSVQIAQSILGILTLVLLWATVRRDLGTRAAWVAGALYTFFGPILAMESQVLTESLLCFLATAALWSWPRHESGAARYALFGAICGLLTIGRGTFLLLPLAAGILLLLRGRGNRMRVTAARLGLLLLGLLLPLAPLAAHQTRTSGRWQVFTMNGGLNLYLGNNPAARGIYSSPPDIDLEADITGSRSASLLEGRKLSVAESSDYWRNRAIRFLKTRPGRAAWLWTRKALLFFSPKEIPQIENFQVLAETVRPLRIAFLRFGWILPLFVLGAIAARGGTRQRLVPYLVLVAVGWISTVLFFATGRYRISILPGFLAPAALGVLDLAGALRARRLPRAAWIVPAVVVLELLLPRYPEAKARAYSYYQTALRYTAAGEHEKAMRDYRLALQSYPAMGEAWHGIGVTLTEQGHLPEAAEAYRKALELIPRSGLTRLNLGIVEARLGKMEEAAEQFRAAVAIDPMNPDFRYNLGRALAELGDAAGAVREWRRALELDPGHEGARQALRAVPESIRRSLGTLPDSIRKAPAP